MDLSKLDVRAAAEIARDMPLLHPGTGEPTGATLSVLGYDADAVLSASRQFDREAMAKGDDLGARAEARRIVLAQAALVGWSGFEWEGSEVAFDKAFADDLLSRPGFSWIVQQIHSFGGSRANLFPEPPNS